MSNPGLMIATTYLEWIRWIATGRIRCGARISRVDGPEDRVGFDEMMDRAPDFAIEDDQAYVLARLSPEAMGSVELVKSLRTIDAVWIPLDCVEAFYPLSERGFQLLEADAERAGVRLGRPIFEEAWKAWRTARSEEAARVRGQLLCQALRLPLPKLHEVPEEIRGFVLGESPLPNADKATGLEATRAFGWAAAFAVFGVLAGYEVKNVQTEQLGLAELVKECRADYAIDKPVLALERLLGSGRKLTEVLRSCGRGDVSVPMLAAIFHYQHLVRSDRAISLDALLDDLTCLAMESGAGSASVAAYAIGRWMDDVAVTSLLYGSMPEKYPALATKPPTAQLDIGARAALRTPMAGKSEHGGLPASPDEVGSVRSVEPVPSGSEASEAPRAEPIGALPSVDAVPRDPGVSAAPADPTALTAGNDEGLHRPNAAASADESAAEAAAPETESGPELTDSAGSLADAHGAIGDTAAREMNVDSPAVDRALSDEVAIAGTSEKKPKKRRQRK